MIFDIIFFGFQLLILFLILYSFFYTEVRKVCYELDLYDWDMNYLGHDFSDPKTNDLDMRKCERCGIFVYHNEMNNRYNIISNNYMDPYPTLTITCDEMIIKNIIE